MNFVKSYNPNFKNVNCKSMVQQKVPKTKIIRKMRGERMEDIYKELENLRKIEKEHQKLNGELREEIRRLNNIINELEKHLEEELDRLARETSNTYEDSLGKTRFVNEDIYNEIGKIKYILQELKGSNK